ncbi:MULTISPECIES: DUF3103 family protein [unclassified Streptomyces]|uniref:DUF3103 family protein n=1 Tax=unclassified Streptomyces TaxID=2593676 RepID=UPI002E81E23C|nr:DUF3103 family protein [Streptomyces sp. NBC_00562]WTC83961.1 DUF3103 domain-containing protein [Streptomyces sp. NBC_01653]WTD86905.1 DUF3103 domain-containing protein [Streptomyces sp. NBC_01637]WUC17991.1 DUF3103 domain-containing protein [Streptomyces sp. NBC_00562]
MSKKQLRRTALVAVLLTAVTAATAQGAVSASAEAPAAQPSAAAPSTVRGIEDDAARSLAVSLADAGWRSQVRSAALSSAQVDVQALAARATTRSGKALIPAVREADRRIAAAKGLAANTGSLLRVRLGDASMREDLTGGAVPLVAAAPADDDAATITAYDSHGRAHTLDAREVPQRPVYVVDIDVSKALAAGLGVLRAEFAKHGVTTPQPQAQLAAGGWWSTRVTSVELADDEEPWVKGDAEVYTLVTGFGLDGKARVDTVDMPYLNNDGVVYYPNQILVNWSNYKYNLADAVMMEDDGDTNYQALAQALTTALLTITDQGAYIPLVNAILAAIPTSWWTDDPDYVDSWYTLARSDSGRRNGAAGNGWMTVEPYFVEQF